nr:uncharacterized protein LOC104100954 [Nicotiana tomentosiformis]
MVDLAQNHYLQNTNPQFSSLSSLNLSTEMDKNEFISLRDRPFPCRFRYISEDNIQQTSITAKNHQPNHKIDEIERVGNNERKHFSHRHNLLMYSLRASDCVHCYFCETIISGMAYGCKRCRYFLHESCSEFPQLIEHLAHPGHQLTLKYTPTFDSGYICKACHVGDNPALLFNFHYSCNLCDFAIHMGCASMPCKVFHKETGLSLFYSNPLKNEAGPLLCDICNHSINKTNSWVYYDHSHNFITHFGCAADSIYGKGKDDKSYIMGVKTGLTNLDGDDTSIVHYQKYDEGKKDERFFHRHGLHLLDRSQDNIVKNHKCGICGLDLSTDKKKGCSTCDYIIHERCSQLPEKIQHPFHPHTLTLVPKKDGVEVQCNGCRQSSGCHTNYTVLYQCKICDFQLHPSCAACPRRLKKLDLTLCYSFPYKNEVSKLFCSYCSKVINKDQWLYYGRNKDEKRHITCQLAVGVSNCYVTLRDLEVE